VSVIVLPGQLGLAPRRGTALQVRYGGFALTALAILWTLRRRRVPPARVR
jgi:hypothetical protein